MRKPPIKNALDDREFRVSLSCVIEDIYLPFYDDHTHFERAYDAAIDHDIYYVQPDCWIPLQYVSNLLKKHRATEYPWLRPVRLKADNRQDATREPPATFEDYERVRTTVPRGSLADLGGDSEYLLIKLHGFGRALSYPFVSHEDMRLLDQFIGDWKSLPIICKMSGNHSATFLADYVQSRDGVDLLNGINACLNSGSLQQLKNNMISLPPRTRQIRSWVSRAIEHNKVKQATERLLNRHNEQQLTLEQQDNITRFRLEMLHSVAEQKPDDFSDFQRVVNPLPYFFEYPILQWERANDKMAFSSAVSLLHLLNKISCLIGFEEVISAGKGSGIKSLLGDELIGQLSGKPSLGSWSKALEILEKHSSHFKVWQGWFKALSGERDNRIKLISIRNRISHPDCVLEESQLDEAGEAFDAYFKRLIPKLRAAYAGISTIITHGRKVIKSSDGSSTTLVDCEKLDAPVEPFPRVTLEMTNPLAANLTDECLTSLRHGEVIELRRFFQLRKVKTSLCEIFLYERDYSGKDAVWAGLTTAQSGKLETPPRLFD